MSGQASDDRLRLIVERIERLLEERRGISDDIRDVYAEAKAVGYDAAIIRKLVARRAMHPDERAEADVMLETYEAAVGMASGEGARPIGELHPDAADIALSMLTEQVAGISEPEQAEALIAHVLFLLDLRAEIAALRLQERERKARAKLDGFDAKQVSLTVRWYEKCAKHGEDAMKLGEATFQLYRSTVDTHDGGSMVTDDPKLQAAFAPVQARKPKKINKTAEMLRENAAAARAALGRNS